MAAQRVNLFPSLNCEADDGTRWRREEGYDRITDIPICEWLPRFFPKFENSRSLLPHIKRDGAFHNVPLIRCSHGRGETPMLSWRGDLLAPAQNT